MNYLHGLQDEEEIYDAMAQQIADEVDREIIEKLTADTLKDKLKRRVREINERYPHRCPFCGSPAYIGLASLDCLNECNVPRRRVVMIDVDDE
jgi:hypothetical protein